MNIKEFRKKHNLSQRKLAELLQVNPRTVQKWESGERVPHPMTIALIERMEADLDTSPQKCD